MDDFDDYDWPAPEVPTLSMRVTWLDNPKMRKAGPVARDFWLSVACQIARNHTDGHVNRHTIDIAALYADLEDPGTVIRTLVKVGLWHSSAALKSCDRCAVRSQRLSRGEFYVHDWLDWNAPSPLHDDDFSERLWHRHRALYADLHLCSHVVGRDRSCCRWCGRHVNWRAGGHDSVRVDMAASWPDELGVYRHVDPWRHASADNVAVSCASCFRGDER